MRAQKRPFFPSSLGHSSQNYAEYPRNLAERAIIYTFAAQIRNSDIRNRNNEKISHIKRQT